ncbi:MAG: YihY/virulence factor BrkB family protein [bacterium]|nr:YihY/virulence factor BrkB family protein [bacterium]
MAFLKNVLNLFRQTFEKWNADQAPRQAAALAYYTVFSLAPLLIVVIALAGAVFGEEAIRNQIAGQIQDTVGEDAASLVQDLIANANQRDEGAVSTVLGVVTLLLGSIAIFSNLQATLNIIWKVDKPKPKAGIVNTVLMTLQQKLWSFGLLLVVGLLLMISLVANTFIAVISNTLFERLPGEQFLLNAVGFTFAWFVTALLFALIYKVLPDARIAWREVAVGAGVTALLFSIGRLVLSLYLANSSTASAYGAAGSIVVLLLWVYYSAQIVLFGAEFTYVYAHRNDQKTLAEGAAAVTRDERASTERASEKTAEDRTPEGPTPAEAH